MRNNIEIILQRTQHFILSQSNEQTNCVFDKKLGYRYNDINRQMRFKEGKIKERKKMEEMEENQ